ncbi:MAG TPA: serine hydrolase domain-containing protein [Gemmatimonadaceae bacterium]|nr:serine hydrolase domain-containing protein [Gemmatimonadaceae bacterium]
MLRKFLAAGTLGALVVWQAGSWYVERAAEMPTSPTTCGSYVDPRFRDALPMLRAQAASIMATRRIPGMAVAVMLDGRTVYHEGFGLADLEHGVPACPDTRFRAASVSKLFTAAAMARLVERRRLDLDAPIQRLVPEFPEKGATVTPRLLASHRAGIRAYHDDREAINTTHYASVVASLRAFADDPLAAAPGSTFIYSNYGYVLLSAAIERAAGTDFLDAMHHEVFDPLGMSSTTADVARATIARRTTTYDTETPFSPDGSLVRSPFNDLSAKWASGGFLSTVDDLTRFGDAHVRDVGFLRPETIALLMRPRSGAPPLVGYGLGWMTASDLHLRRVHFHFGASSGATSMLAVYPGSRVVVAVMANLGHAKFPFAPLVNFARPFQPFWSPDRVLLAMLCIALAARRLTPRAASAGRTVGRASRRRDTRSCS